MDKHTFPVSLTKVYTINQEGKHSDGYAEVSGRRAVERLDTRQVLGIVSDKYEIITHEEVIRGFREALGGTDFSEKISLTRNGAHMWATYTLKNHTLEVVKGDVVGLQFTAKNSYDGMTALQFSLGALRLVCLNGMVMGNRFFSYQQRHFGKDVHVDIETLTEKIGILAEKFEKQLPMMQLMTKAPYTGDFTEEGLAKRLPAYLIEAAVEEFKKGGDQSNWGFYNALTHAITHHMRRESPEAQLRYGRNAWQLATMEATGARLN